MVKVNEAQHWAQLGETARAHGLKLHMDGARFSWAGTAVITDQSGGELHAVYPTTLEASSALTIGASTGGDMWIRISVGNGPSHFTLYFI